MEFGVADGKKGLQALSVSVIDSRPSVVKSSRKPADDMAVIVEDLIKLLDGLGNQMRRGRQPAPAESRKIAALLRAVADDLDV